MQSFPSGNSRAPRDCALPRPSAAQRLARLWKINSQLLLSLSFPLPMASALPWQVTSIFLCLLLWWLLSSVESGKILLCNRLATQRWPSSVRGTGVASDKLPVTALEAKLMLREGSFLPTAEDRRRGQAWRLASSLSLSVNLYFGLRQFDTLEVVYQIRMQ